MRGPLRRRLAAHTGPADAGVSLVEMLVVMALIGVVGLITVSTMVGSLRASTTATERGEDVAVVRGVLDEVTKTLRTATDPDGDGPELAFKTATPTTVSFYAALNTLQGVSPTSPKPPVLVTYAVVGRTLTETRTAGVKGSDGTVTWPGSGTTRTLSTNVQPSPVVATGTSGCTAAPATRPYFTYLAKTDGLTPAQLDCGGGSVSSLAMAAAGTPTTAARSLVGAVEVWIAVRGADLYAGNPASLVNRVTLIN